MSDKLPCFLPKPIGLTDEQIAEQTVNCVGAWMGVTREQILGRSRADRIKVARHVSMYLISGATGMSSLGIGRLFEKDHATVLYALKKIAERRDMEPRMDKVLKDFEREIARMPRNPLSPIKNGSL